MVNCNDTHTFTLLSEERSRAGIARIKGQAYDPIKAGIYGKAIAPYERPGQRKKAH